MLNFLTYFFFIQKEENFKQRKALKKITESDYIGAFFQIRCNPTTLMVVFKSQGFCGRKAYFEKVS